MKTVILGSIMSEFPNEDTQFSTTNQPPNRGNKKGNLHLSTRIQNMLNDDEFTTQLVSKDGKKVAFKGNPAEAIIKTAILKSMSGDKSWADWLANNGYGIKQVHEFENNPIITILNKYGLKGDEDAGQTSEVEG